MSAGSIIPAPPGTEPSPFDPTPWPPWDKVAAAGLGEFYGATIRRLDGARESAPDAVAFGKAQIATARELGKISGADATRLVAYITLHAPGHESEPPTSAAKLFQETLDDASASPLATAILSIAKYKEETEELELSSWEEGYIMGALMVLTPSTALAGAVASHIHVTWR